MKKINILVSIILASLSSFALTINTNIKAGIVNEKYCDEFNGTAESFYIQYQALFNPIKKGNATEAELNNLEYNKMISNYALTERHFCRMAGDEKMSVKKYTQESKCREFNRSKKLMLYVTDKKLTDLQKEVKYQLIHQYENIHKEKFTYVTKGKSKGQLLNPSEATLLPLLISADSVCHYTEPTVVEVAQHRPGAQAFYKYNGALFKVRLNEYSKNNHTDVKHPIMNKGLDARSNH